MKNSEIYCDNDNNILEDEERKALENILICKCQSSPIYCYTKRIYNLFANNKILEPTDNYDYYYLGVYYQYIDEKYDLMKKYYLYAIDKNIIGAMENLGIYYENIERKSDLAEKYFLMTIEKGNIEQVVYLAHYYKYKEKYELMKKYYLMAIEKGNINSMYKLGKYYEYTERNYDLMKKYYLMAVDRGNSDAMNNLGCYYRLVEKNYDLMKKYYLQATEKGNSDAMIDLGEYYEIIEINYDLMKKYYLKAIEAGNGTAVIRLTKYYKYDPQPTAEDLQNCLLALINGKFRFLYVDLFKIFRTISKTKIVDLYCKNIDVYNLGVEDFTFFVDYINIHTGIMSSQDIQSIVQTTKLEQLEHFNHFVKYISKLYYYKCKKKNKEKNNFKNYIFYRTSQLFMEYLEIYYYKHLKKMYAPGGKGYVKTKNHFESIVKQSEKK